ncbi:UbiA-like polyprenyltransferase [Compostibacter hankyongensis]|uniref:UbiA-like polyprenyltransferase n=1 Tax=Compostibacter hankyongensis TaxID=1007089 RepID=A0ABP8FI89_9BACT
MKTIARYLSLVKFSHTIFAMPFALIGFFLALRADAGALSLRVFLLVLVCMVSARSAAMAFNRYLDRHFDARNPRTAIREIPRGIISPGNALRFVIGNALVFVAATWFINPLCFYLSPVALFVVLFYSYTKRFTPLCHLVLGLGLSLAPIGAYLAVTGHFALLPVLFSLIVLGWVSGFDIIYALQDDAFDRQQHLHSIPVWLGRKKALAFSTLLHTVSALLVIAVGLYGQFHWLYWLGTAVFVGMLVYQHWLVKPDDLSRVNLAFMTANGIASCVFALFVIGALFFPA